MRNYPKTRIVNESVSGHAGRQAGAGGVEGGLALDTDQAVDIAPVEGNTLDSLLVAVLRQEFEAHNLWFSPPNCKWSTSKHDYLT